MSIHRDIEDIANALDEIATRLFSSEPHSASELQDYSQRLMDLKARVARLER